MRRSGVGVGGDVMVVATGVEDAGVVHGWRYNSKGWGVVDFNRGIYMINLVHKFS